MIHKHYNSRGSVKLYLLVFSVLLFCSVVHAEDLDGNPLPDPVITQDTHDQLVENQDWLEVYGHWIAAGHTIIVTNAEIFRARQNGILIALDTCGKLYNVRSGAAPQGFVWKARSERSGNPVMLLPPSYYQNVINVRADDMTLGFNANQTFDSGRERSELQNDNRAHYDFQKRASSYPFYFLVRVRLRSDRVDCFFISDPETDIRK